MDSYFEREMFAAHYAVYDHDEHDLILNIFSQIAKEKNKSLEQIKRLLLIKQKPDLNRRFWEILDAKLPNHGFEYVGCCAECGGFELH
jgi:hypothetical protein